MLTSRISIFQLLLTVLLTLLSTFRKLCQFFIFRTPVKLKQICLCKVADSAARACLSWLRSVFGVDGIITLFWVLNHILGDQSTWLTFFLFELYCSLTKRRLSGSFQFYTVHALISVNSHPWISLCVGVPLIPLLGPLKSPLSSFLARMWCTCRGSQPSPGPMQMSAPRPASAAIDDGPHCFPRWRDQTFLRDFSL